MLDSGFKWVVLLAGIVLLIVVLLWVIRPTWFAQGQGSLLDRYDRQDPVAPETAASKKACRYPKLSSAFREVAGDAFDRLQTLEESELKGKIFFEAANQNASTTLFKAQRYASSPDEVKFTEILVKYRDITTLYRSTMEFSNALRSLPEDPKDKSPKLDPQVVKTQYENEQKDLKATISACLS